MSGEYCSCGQRLNQWTGDTTLAQAIYENGELVYAVCAHGKIIIDKRLVKTYPLIIEEEKP